MFNMAANEANIASAFKGLNLNQNGYSFYTFDLNKNTIPQHYVPKYGYWLRFIFFDWVVSKNIVGTKFSLAPLYSRLANT